MKQVLISVFILYLAFQSTAQERSILRIPDIPGYKTLVCDFHLHTVFSDGLVWPTVRVDEAWREGLDAIAITDHLEYLPHKEDINTNYNRSWKIAEKYAMDKDVIVIPGTEITKGMPPGHFNALFIKDAQTIVNEDYKIAIKEATSQGAFIMWNHPGWKAQQPDTMKWWDEHDYLYDNGLLHGIEVANAYEFYPEAINWARNKNLTILGNSDQHAPFTNTDFNIDHHRTCTFVFAAERSIGGIREALFNGRTIAIIGNNMIGSPSLLKAIFLESVKLKKVGHGKSKYMLINQTDLYFEMIVYNKIYEDWERKIKLNPGIEYYLRFEAENLPEELQIKVINMMSGSEEFLSIPLSSLKYID